MTSKNVSLWSLIPSPYVTYDWRSMPVYIIYVWLHIGADMAVGWWRRSRTNLFAATVRTRSAMVGTVHAASTATIDLGYFASLRGAEVRKSGDVERREKDIR